MNNPIKSHLNVQSSTISIHIQFLLISPEIRAIDIKSIQESEKNILPSWSEVDLLELPLLPAEHDWTSTLGGSGDRSRLLQHGQVRWTCHAMGCRNHLDPSGKIMFGS